MDTRRVLQVDAFAAEPLSGNAAGVVPDADGLTDDQMRAVARELAVSETAFLRSSSVADRRVRYFTPTREVDLCGHATIGSFVHLHEDGVVASGTSTLETNVGVLDVEVAADGTVWMSQADPELRTVDVGYDRVADALGVERAALEGASADLPLAVASTGLPFLIVPITYLSDVGGADPDVGAVEALSEAVDATGIYLFSFDTLEADSTVHGRTFAPAAGVPEDPVTGTASGAAGAYLEQFGAFDGRQRGPGADGRSRDGTADRRAADGEVDRTPAEDDADSSDDSGGVPDEMRFEQGHYVDRPGYVRVRVDETVRVGGRGVVAVDGTIAVPDDGDDEILEA